MKWQYRFDSFDPMNPGEAIDRLDALGRGGWELVTSYIEGPGKVGLIFKKEGEAPVDTSRR